MVINVNINCEHHVQFCWAFRPWYLCTSATNTLDFKQLLQNIMCYNNYINNKYVGLIIEHMKKYVAGKTDGSNWWITNRIIKALLMFKVIKDIHFNETVIIKNVAFKPNGQFTNTSCVVFSHKIIPYRCWQNLRSLSYRTIKSLLMLRVTKKSILWNMSL